MIEGRPGGGQIYFGDSTAKGVRFQSALTVAFNARELWCSRGHVNDTIHVELWDYHLEAA
jgi:hypothetical protein